MKSGGIRTVFKITWRYLHIKIFGKTLINNRYESSSVPRFNNIPSILRKSFDFPSRAVRLRCGFTKDLYQLRPWYHDFASFGFETVFAPEKKWKILGPIKDQVRQHVYQQPRKEKYIRKYIETASINLPAKPSILDLFCADGYYGFVGQSINPDSILDGVDLNQYDIKRAKYMARMLGKGKTNFVCEDVFDFVHNNQNIYDLVINVGGLYHVSDPQSLLKASKKIINGYMVVGSATDSKNESDSYFVSPRPNFQFGSWFSHNTLKRWLSELNFEIIEEGKDVRSDANISNIAGSYFLVKLS